MLLLLRPNTGKKERKPYNCLTLREPFDKGHLRSLADWLSVAGKSSGCNLRSGFFDLQDQMDLAVDSVMLFLRLPALPGNNQEA